MGRHGRSNGRGGGSTRGERPPRGLLPLNRPPKPHKGYRRKRKKKGEVAEAACLTFAAIGEFASSTRESGKKPP